MILQIGSSLDDKGGITTVENQIYNSYLKNKYNIKQVDTYITGKKLSLFIKAYFKIKRYKKKYNAKLAHIHMASKGSFYRKAKIIKLCNKLGIKVILHCHGSEFEKFYNSSKRQKYIKKILNRVDKLIVLSDSWKEFYSKLVPEEKIEVIYNGIDIPNTITKKSNDVKVGLFLGRIGKRKGIYDLIDSVELLKNKNEGLNFKIKIAGDGEIENIKEIIKEKDLEKYFEVLGWISGKEKEEIIQESDFFILPSYNEGLPMSILEAMSRKVLVISSDVGGIPEVIKDKENGLLVEAGNKEKIAEAIKYAVENNCEEIIEKAYEKVCTNFNIEENIKRIDKIYENLITKSIKVCLASSSGGHFMQLKQLMPKFEKYDIFVVTEKNISSLNIKEKYKTYFLVQQERRSFSFLFKFGYNILKSIYIVRKEKPDVIISTGAGATYALCKLVHKRKGKVIFIESFAKVTSPTLTGKKVYKFADSFYVQWKEMLKIYPDAKYKGAIY